MSSRYAAAKPYALPASLADLVGPTVGTVTLPRHIDWGPHYAYDLSDDADVLLMYERVIREAQTPADLNVYLNAVALRRRWRDLFLPAPVRAAWETRFPELGPGLHPDDVAAGKTGALFTRAKLRDAIDVDTANSRSPKPRRSPCSGRQVR